MFCATLNVCQHHRQWANINPALVQSIMPVPTACRNCQHEVLTRAEWILASTSSVGPTFNRHWVSVGLYSPPAGSTTRPACNWTQLPAKTRGHTSAGLMLGSVADCGTALNQHWVDVVFAGSVDKPHCFSHMEWSSKRNNKFCLIHSLYCPQEPFNNINYNSH